MGGWVINGWAHVKSLKSNKSWPDQDNSIMDFLDILLKPHQPFIGLFFYFSSCGSFFVFLLPSFTIAVIRFGWRRGCILRWILRWGGRTGNIMLVPFFPVELLGVEVTGRDIAESDNCHVLLASETGIDARLSTCGWRYMLLPFEKLFVLTETVITLVTIPHDKGLCWWLYIMLLALVRIVKITSTLKLFIWVGESKIAPWMALFCHSEKKKILLST